MGSFPQPRRRGPDRPRDRLKTYLHDRYSGRPGALAQDLSVSPKRAENLLRGHWPADDLTLGSIFARFGRDAWDAIFAPDIEKTRARLAAERRALEDRLEENARLFREAGGAVGSDQEHLPAPESPRPADLTREDRAP